MRASDLWDGSIAVCGHSATLIFNRICAGIGWPDAEDGALCVVGESAAGTYHALGERRGTLLELGRAVVQTKAELLVDCFFVDASDEISTGYLRSLEGPRDVTQEERKSTEKPKMSRSGVFHPHGSGDPLVIAGVRPRYRDHFRGALEAVRGIIESQRLVVNQVSCPSLTFALHRPLDYMVTSPVITALVWAITAMEVPHNHAWADCEPEDGWYVNFVKKIR
jgi:hypothetical protein